MFTVFLRMGEESSEVGIAPTSEPTSAPATVSPTTVGGAAATTAPAVTTAPTPTTATTAAVTTTTAASGVGASGAGRLPAGAGETPNTGGDGAWAGLGLGLTAAALLGRRALGRPAGPTPTRAGR